MINEKDKGLCAACKVLVSTMTGKPLERVEDVLTCLDHFRYKKQEYFVTLSLDSNQQLIARRVITIGLLNTTLTHPREVFAGAIEDRAASVIIAHNHPSGNPYPSRDDIKTTQQLVAAGKILGVDIRDHIIVAQGKHYSFMHEGLL